jgi:hypothetical protein
VTGTHGAQFHMGNAVVPDRDKPDQLEKDGTQNLTDLTTRLDTRAYLSPHSDIVALMVLEHQTHMTNLITRVGFEARMALHTQNALARELNLKPGEMTASTRSRIHTAADELVEYLLFADEVRLEAPVKGTSQFAGRFAAQGPRDARGRSLRELDLKTRLFRYPCSYLIYSDAFEAMPELARERIYRRLYDILTGADSDPKWARLTSVDRQAILEIVRATKKELPAYWHPTEGS